MEFHEKLVNARKKRGMTQKELAELLEITPSRLNYWEKGKRQPDVMMIKNLSTVLGVSANILIGLENEPTTEESSTTEPTEKESQLLSKYRILDDIDQGKIDERIDIMLEHEKYAVKKDLLNA